MPKVLVIDDATVMRNSLCRLLRKEGFDTVSVGDGLEALGAVGAQPPDVIVLDLNMPHMNGLEVLERLRRNLLWRTVPVLVFSGRVDAAAAKRATELGATEVLQKATVSAADLIDRIRALTNPPSLEAAVAAVPAAGTGGGRL
ncbi:MAG: cheY1 [Phycisphaerales bacterium]|nr:cheY1 [Phycisphaerales bacterium]